MIRDFRLFMESRERLLVIGFLSLLLLGGVVYSVYLGDALRYYDEAIYMRMAESIVDEHQVSLDGVTPTAIRPPGYSFVLSVLVLLGSEVFALRLLNYLALCAGAFLLYRILKNEDSGLAGLLGLCCLACYPVLFYMASSIYPQTMAGALFLIIVYLYFRKDTHSPLELAAIGLIFGALILMVATYVFVLFFFLVWVMFEKQKEKVKSAAIVLALALLLICPWIVRNCLVFHSFVFVSTNSGYMLLLGNSENTQPGAGPTTDITKYKSGARGNEAEIDRYHARKALEFMERNKARTVKLYAQKLLNHFNFRNDVGEKSDGSKSRDVVMFLTYGPLLLLGLARVLAARRMPMSRFELFSVLLYMLNGATSAIFFTRIRYRAPFDFLLIGVVALFLAALWRLVEMREQASSQPASK